MTDVKQKVKQYQTQTMHHLNGQCTQP